MVLQVLGSQDMHGYLGQNQHSKTNWQTVLATQEHPQTAHLLLHVVCLPSETGHTTPIWIGELPSKSVSILSALSFSLVTRIKPINEVRHEFSTPTTTPLTTQRRNRSLHYQHTDDNIIRYPKLQVKEYQGGHTPHVSFISVKGGRIHKC